MRSLIQSLLVLLWLAPNLWATPVVLPASSAEIPEKHVMIAHTDFSDAKGDVAKGWMVNAWGSPMPRYTASITTDKTKTYASHPAAQHFSVSDNGGGAAHLIYPYDFEPGKTYQATLYMRADTPARVSVTLRHDAPYYEAFAARTVSLTSAWTPVTVTGTYPYTGKGSLRVISLTPGADIYVGQMSLSTLSRNALAPIGIGQKIPDTFFGMLVNKLGVHHNWPGLNTHILRLWDTGTTWLNLQPSRDAWDFGRADYYLDYAEKNGAQVLFTLGQTPQWAAKYPDAKCAYKAGCSPVAQEEDWRTYVRTLATHYGSRVIYWELWNEPDYSGFWSGTPAELARLAQIAQEEIKKANPDAKLIGPAVTNVGGVAFLDSFLAAGGGQYLDGVSFHAYYGIHPEDLVTSIDNMRGVLAEYGMKGLPLWNTEGAPSCDAATRECAAAVTDDADKLSLTPRALLVMAAKGLSGFDYYNWEITWPLAQISEPGFGNLTPVGVAYGEAVDWLKGASVTDAYAFNGVFAVRLEVDGKSETALWSQEDGIEVQLPESWHLTSAKTLEGTATPISDTGTITLTRKPVLLQ